MTAKYAVRNYKVLRSSFLCALIFSLLEWAAVSDVSATHNLAGQIALRHMGGNTYEITLITYTDPAPAGVDRCKADFEIWTCNQQKVGEILDVPRNNGPIDTNPQNDCPPGVHLGVEVYQTVKRNIYMTQYTFPGQGCYLVRYFDPARREDVINIKEPGVQTFFVETQLSILNPLLGVNNTPVLLNEPLDEACIGKIWTHNPGAYDPDGSSGDSLVYSLLPSLQYHPDKGITSPIATTDYRFPDDNSFGASDFTIDTRTGVITWDSPQQIGVYNVAFKVEEYRNGLLLGYVIRDMVIFVKPCDNNPPVIETTQDTCITAGDTLRLKYRAWDPDNEDSVYLAFNNGIQGLNGPWAEPNPPTLAGWVVDPDTFSSFNPWPYSDLPVGTLNGEMTIDTINGVITWITECGNIRSPFFQIDFFAHDNFSYFGNNNHPMLTAHKAVSVTVIPPRPRNLEITKEPGRVTLKWDPNVCDRVVGYNVYRIIGDDTFSQDTVCCDMSPAEMGFELVGYNKGRNNVTLIDTIGTVTNVLGDEICYVVTAMFEDDPQDGFDPNIESCGTQACIKIENDKLYLTNASVVATSSSAGSIDVAWTKPDSIDSFFEGPFFYRLYRAYNNQYPVIPVVSGLNFDTDTFYTDTGIDTEQRGYNYRVEVVNGDGAIIFTTEDTNQGTSIFLSTTGGNGIIDLEWTEFVPWSNQDYEIHRSENGGMFLPIATVPGTGANTHTFTDTGLDKEIEYCYFIRGIGSYNMAGIKDPLINDSQHACDFARDDQPPCTPSIVAEGNCDSRIHTISISKASEPCADETRTITVFFAERVEGPYNEVIVLDYDSLDAVTTLTFPVNDGRQTFAGCYAVTATDAYNNTSNLSDPFCVDFCPLLEMSNVFTPNGDGINDILVPVRHRDVRLVEFSLFDRWGREVHETDNELSYLWDGVVDFSGKQAREGVYYYVIIYDELSILENKRKILMGWVTLLR